jgi:serine/threonine-protein kinase
MDEAQAQAPPLAPGARIGRYELAVLVCEDDVGSVWLAHEELAGGTERVVRLRFPSPGLAADERFRVLLRQEVKLAAGVAHAHVAQVLGVVGDEEGAEPRLLGVASEWVPGETLADLRAAAQRAGVAFPPPILLRLLADACAGLHAAHLVRERSGNLLNVVHGNVSAESIVVGASGVARIVDLGFMKAYARHAGTANPALPGKGGAVQRVDRHADVWGIGAILSQTLAGSGGTDAGPDGTGQTVPELVAELVLRARSTDPVERFATAAEMQGAIEAAMVTLGISATRGSVLSFAKELVGERTAAREAAARASRAKPAAVVSIPTPAVESVPATAQTVRPDGERPVVNTPPIAVTASVLSRTLAGAAPPPPPDLTRPTPRARAALFAVGFLVAVLGSLASAYLATRARSSETAAVRAPSPVLAAAVAPPPAPTCPSGMVEVAPSARDAPRLCLDAALVTTEAYKACSDAGDCKRAATENRWPGIAPRDRTAFDPLCHERDPKRYAKQPANCVDQGMAAIYCATRGARLPTDAESALLPQDPAAGAISEWSRRHDPPDTRSYAVGFRCARAL